MADESTVTLTKFLYDMADAMEEQYAKFSVLYDELGRTKAEVLQGLQVRVPMILNLKQGTVGMSETATMPAPQTLNSNAAYIPMGRIGHAVSLTPDLIYAARAGNFAVAGGALKLEMEAAESAMKRTTNEYLNGPNASGSATGVLATASASTNTTAITVPTTSNWYQLYANRVVDIVTVATGVVIAAGTGRVITGNPVKTTGVVTLDAGGGAVNVTTGTHGIAVAAGAQGPQGLTLGTAITGVVQGIDKALVPQWQGTDGRQGDTTAADLSIQILDGCERQARPSGRAPDFYVGDRAVVDKFGQTMLTVSRWQGQSVKLDTGWTGVAYRDKAIIPDDDSKTQRVTGVNKTALSLYSYFSGPQWDNLDGGELRRLSRTLPVEAWLIDFIQLGFHSCNSLIFADNLNQAA